MLVKFNRKMVIFALTLIRHGETGANKDNIIQGQMDVPLSAAGRVQADLLGDRLQHQCYTHVFASDLVRAQQTLKTIIDKSHFVKFTVVSDERLRERKFGEVEGKSVGELRKLARLANQAPPNFTPSGAETVQQVRNRAVLFFRELCQQLLQMNVEVANESDSSDVGFHESDCREAPKRRRQSSSTGESVHEGETKAKQAPPCLTDNRVDRSSSIRFTAFEPIRDDQVKTQASPSTAQLCVYVPSRRSRRQIYNKKVSPLDNCLPTGNYAPMDIDCPNVTLFPLGDHKFLKVSDRKASVDSLTDDAGTGSDLRPAANVLVVSHGGLLREMVRHFVEDLGCAVPGGKGQALRLSPNTGLSKFTVSFENKDEDPKVICLQIHDKDHLVAGHVTAVNSVAL